MTQQLLRDMKWTKVAHKSNSNGHPTFSGAELLSCATVSHATSSSTGKCEQVVVSSSGVLSAAANGFWKSSWPSISPSFVQLYQIIGD
ncbi:hypothetical protein HPP92_019237 [Vanilla planifolia]|uniref:Uncharacterized protein n=1 Tax=Vanilla planifolia TaxID=51239 RepID=A0A835QEJ5_VANPL|nr:hypothetical protein HPP92_019237 [Vanilla planifolia]